MKLKFLVFGVSGMAGHTISLYLKEKGHEVIGYDKIINPHIDSIVGDARETEKVKKIINEGDFNTIINCIGILNQFAEEKKELAVFLNSYFPHYLASLTSETNTQIIQMSTDCVFSGNSGSYKETDFKDGQTFYDRSKALGELVDDKNLTFRNSIIGPDTNIDGIGLFNWFMKQNGPITGFQKAIWTGLTTLELAKAMEAAAKVKATGLYNMVYKESINKYDLLLLFNKYLKNNTLSISPSEQNMPDKSLIRTNFNFDYIIPSYEIMISELTQWIKGHKSLYPHYQLF